MADSTSTLAGARGERTTRAYHPPNKSVKLWDICGHDGSLCDLTGPRTPLPRRWVGGISYMNFLNTRFFFSSSYRALSIPLAIAPRFVRRSGAGWWVQ
eukprot:gene11571-biopygen12422